MTLPDAHVIAVRAAQSWGGVAGTPRLVHHRENTVFEVHLKTGDRAALRLHRPDYQSTDAIEGELFWTYALARKGFPCPRPLMTRDEAFLIEEGGYQISVVQWMRGEPLSGLDLDQDEKVSLFQGLGRLLAQLHKETDLLRLPRLPRPAWDAEAFTGTNPLWGRFWDNPALSSKDRQLLIEARDAARMKLSISTSHDLGLIHADVLGENVLHGPGGLALIDFDDSGWGYRSYDLATALIQRVDDPAYDALREALLDGYQTVRPVMSQSLPMFLMLRAMASCGWVMSRVPPNDSRQIDYAKRAVRLARGWLDS